MAQTGWTVAVVSNTLSTANGFGLVLDGDHTEAVVTQANAIFDNTQFDTATDLGLDIPPPPEQAVLLPIETP